jgi:hypothetical protein
VGDLRILDPYSPAKLATLGQAVKLKAGDLLVDLCCGKGELLRSWTRHTASAASAWTSAPPSWPRLDPPDQPTVEACHARTRDDHRPLPALVAHFGAEIGWDVVEMVLAGQDDWDRYAAAHWLNIRTWLDANPDDELAPRMRAELDTDPVRHVRYRREYLGWGVFALRKRG